MSRKMILEQLEGIFKKHLTPNVRQQKYRCIKALRHVRSFQTGNIEVTSDLMVRCKE